MSKVATKLIDYALSHCSLRSEHSDICNYADIMLSCITLFHKVPVSSLKSLSDFFKANDGIDDVLLADIIRCIVIESIEDIYFLLDIYAKYNRYNLIDRVQYYATERHNAMLSENMFWHFLSYNKSVLIEYVIHFVNMPWDWSGLSLLFSATVKSAYPTMPWEAIDYDLYLKFHNKPKQYNEPDIYFISQIKLIPEDEMFKMQMNIVKGEYSGENTKDRTAIIKSELLQSVYEFWHKYFAHPYKIFNHLQSIMTDDADFPDAIDVVNAAIVSNIYSILPRN